MHTRVEVKISEAYQHFHSHEILILEKLIGPSQNLKVPLGFSSTFHTTLFDRLCHSGRSFSWGIKRCWRLSSQEKQASKYPEAAAHCLFTLSQQGPAFVVESCLLDAIEASCDIIIGRNEEGGDVFAHSFSFLNLNLHV